MSCFSSAARQRAFPAHMVARVWGGVVFDTITMVLWYSVNKLPA